MVTDWAEADDAGSRNASARAQAESNVLIEVLLLVRVVAGAAEHKPHQQAASSESSRFSARSAPALTPHENAFAPRLGTGSSSVRRGGENR
jgi:hypothetical protein